MQLNLQVTYRDGEQIVVATDFAIMCDWEEWSGKSVSELAGGVRLVDLAWLAWSACKRDQIVVPVEFASFKKKINNVEPVSETPPRPTVGAPTDAH